MKTTDNYNNVAKEAADAEKSVESTGVYSEIPAEENPDNVQEASESTSDIDTEAANLTKKLSEAEAMSAEYLDKYQRTLAEFDNFRKRTIKEKASMYSDGASDIIKSLLPVIDSFERALAAAEDAEAETPAYKGMALIYKQLRDFMEQNGIKPIEAVGNEFNPTLHQALAHVDDPGAGVNEIVEELQRGYTLNDRVLRHSMVKVAN